MVAKWYTVGVPKCAAIACMTDGRILQLSHKFNLPNISAAAFAWLATHYTINVISAWSDSSCSIHIVWDKSV